MSSPSFVKLAAIALLAAVAPALVWAAEPAAAQEPSGPPEIGEPVEPKVLEEDLRRLPSAESWKPGDPVRVVSEGVDPSVVEGVVDGPAAVPGVFQTDLGQLPTSTGSALAERLESLAPDAPWTLRALGADFALYDRNGERVAGPTPIAILWGGTGGPCDEVATGEGVSLARYDPLAGRWLLSRFVVREGSPGASFCIGIQNGGPALTGRWSVYSFRVTSSPEAATIRVGEDAYCLVLERGSTVEWLDLDRSSLLVGQPATLTSRSSACEPS